MEGRYLQQSKSSLPASKRENCVCDWRRAGNGRTNNATHLHLLRFQILYVATLMKQTGVLFVATL